MKRLLYVMAIGLLISLIFSVWTVSAQTPEVPITYQGDTDETIARRSEWVKGAKKEGKLVWWGILRPEYKTKIIAEFNKIYPFIMVEHWRGGPSESSAKVEAEWLSGRYSVDLLLGGNSYNYPRWRKNGMIQKFTEYIPGLERLDKRMYGKYGDWAIPGNNAITPQYNTDLVSSAEAPKRWEDLLDPKWKGQIAMTQMVHAWYTLALGEGGWGIERTIDFVTKLGKQDLIYTRSHSGAHTLMIAGEFKIMAEGFVYHVLKSQGKGAPVEWARTSPIPVTGPAFTLLAKAVHPNAAKLWIEWLFSPQGLIQYDEITYFGAASPGSGTRLSKTLQGQDVVYRNEEVIIKANDLGLIDKFSKLLGLIPE